MGTRPLILCNTFLDWFRFNETWMKPCLTIRFWSRFCPGMFLKMPEKPRGAAFKTGMFSVENLGTFSKACSHVEAETPDNSLNQSDRTNSPLGTHLSGKFSGKPSAVYLLVSDVNWRNTSLHTRCGQTHIPSDHMLVRRGSPTGPESGWDRGRAGWV